MVDVDMDEISRIWAENWLNAREKMKSKIARKGIKWKKNALSPRAVKSRRDRLKQVIDAGLIEKGLERVDPASWEVDVIKGIDAKTEMTEEEVKKYRERGEKYIKFVVSKKEELDSLELTGKAALDWWYNNVTSKLKDAKLGKITL